jgi:hypothetical protein
MTDAASGQFELHRPLPAVRLSRADMQHLIGLLTEPELAQGLLVHAGYHVRLPAGEVVGDSPEGLPGQPDLPPESSDVFVTVDFGQRERYVRQVLVVFQHDRALLSISSDDEEWMQSVANRVETFTAGRRAWFRHGGLLQRSLLIAGLAIVTLAAALGNFGGPQFRWAATWIFAMGLVGVVASAVLPGRLRYSVVSLVSNQPPGHNLRERALLSGALSLFTIALVGAGIATLLELTG